MLGGSNTYLGDTTVEEGILRISSGNGFASSKVILTNSAFEVASGSITLKELAGYGSVTCEGLTVTNCIAPGTEDCFCASGDVTLANGVTLDLSAFEDEAFSAKDRLLLLVSEGTVRAPEVLSPIPASKMTSAGMIAKTEVVGGALYVVFSSGGTILMIR